MLTTARNLFSRLASSSTAGGPAGFRRRRTTGEHMVDVLEERFVLSTINLVGTDLRINGTNGNDEIRVFHQGDKIRVASRVGSDPWQYQTFRGSVVQSVRIFGNDGNDIIDHDVFRTSRIWGGRGSDTIEGSGLQDIISGDGGQDVIRGWGGDDIIYAGDGADRIWGNNGNDKLYGTNGFNRISGGNGDDLIVGGLKPDSIDGGNGNDRIRGSAGDDNIFAGAGNDTVFGEAGDDRIFATSGVNFLSGGAGNDFIQGGVGNDTVNGDDGDDVVNGFAGNNTVSGGNGDDRVIGGIGRDILSGGAGNDALFGGKNFDDNLTGGAGSDYFIAWQLPNGNLEDTVTDLASEDALMRFRDGVAADGATNGYWTDEEILLVADGFDRLVDATGNTALLKRHTGDSILFSRHRERLDAGGVLADANSFTSEIRFFTTMFDLFQDAEIGTHDRRVVEDTVIHELGHFRDTVAEWSGIEEFRQLSNWRFDENQGWVFSEATTDWASEYAMTNPFEDFAESFAIYITRQDSFSLLFDDDGLSGDTRDWATGVTQTPTGKMAMIARLISELS